jgi:hypothetical protein
LLQPSPEPLKIHFGQFFAHILFTLSEPEPKSWGQAAAASEKGGGGGVKT